MSVIDWIKRFFLRKSINQSQINQSIINPEEETTVLTPIIESTQPSQLELQKESVQLGFAAGYTGRTIRDIESALNRIESQMVTKDWFSIKLEEALKSHEEKEEIRFQRIEEALKSLLTSAEALPEPLKEEIITKIKAVEKEVNLTKRMQELIRIVKEVNEISYADLSNMLGMTQDGLRGLLSIVVKRTNQIERFERENKGWVRYVGIDLTQNQSENQSTNQSIPR